ncbi:MAG: VWA domain-containing protein [Candidatus Competibacteraceae bacterium]
MTSAISLQRGANVALRGEQGAVARIQVVLNWQPRGGDLEIDTSAFLLAANGKVRDDHDMVFYNNARSPEGAVQLLESTAVGGAEARVFQLDLVKLPVPVERVAFAATLDEATRRGRTFGHLSTFQVQVRDADAGTEIARFEMPLEGACEVALIMAEVYRRGGEWKFRAVGQGFNGGLAPLAIQYGIEVAEEPAAAPPPRPAPPSTPTPPPPRPVASPSPSPPPPAPNPQRLNLEKRLVDLAKKDATLVSLAKKAAISLEKKGLLDHRAKVALCLDISGSMSGFYRNGAIATLVQRILALGLRFDDDGEIDVFLFGADAHDYGSVGVEDYRDFVPAMQRRYPLEAGTNYGRVIALIRRHYQRDLQAGQQPVYVMFVTDGETQDRPESERQIRDASREPIFWQFMALGQSKAQAKGFFRRLLASDFGFLAYLDEMPGRLIDNANFFQVADPAEPSDEELYDLLMGEYPQWLTAARKQGLLR